MYRKLSIALVIPARNEARLIGSTLEGVPDLVDQIYVIDDASSDDTVSVVRRMQTVDPRIDLISHQKNTGPGGAIVTGYKKSLKEGYAITVVVGGDNQMPFDQMTYLLDPIVEGRADYTKGNRFLIEGNVYEEMPVVRQLGNAIISILTKIASGYYRIYDVVDGYTAISKKAIGLVPWHRAWKKYGYPMDFLIRLNAYGLRVLDVPRRAVYLKGERQSQIKGMNYALSVSPMLLRGFLWRLFKKYLLRNFHPLLVFYLTGMLFLPTGLIWGIVLIYFQVSGQGVSGPRAVLDALLITVGFQSLLFAMLFDMQDSE